MGRRKPTCFIVISLPPSERVRSGFAVMTLLLILWSLRAGAAAPVTVFVASPADAALPPPPPPPPPPPLAPALLRSRPIASGRMCVGITGYRGHYFSVFSSRFLARSALSRLKELSELSRIASASSLLRLVMGYCAATSSAPNHVLATCA
eukprot:5052114-Pleurochrysis_carterae.AAC.2